MKQDALMLNVSCVLDATAPGAPPSYVAAFAKLPTVAREGGHWRLTFATGIVDATFGGVLLDPSATWRLLVLDSDGEDLAGYFALGRLLCTSFSEARIDSGQIVVSAVEIDVEALEPHGDVPAC